MTEIRVPTLGESVTEATIGRWFKKAGEAVAVDEPLVELETDKVTIEVPAPVAGTLGEIIAKDGETVAVGALLGGWFGGLFSLGLSGFQLGDTGLQGFDLFGHRLCGSFNSTIARARRGRGRGEHRQHAHDNGQLVGLWAFSHTKLQQRSRNLFGLGTLGNAELG